MNAFFHKPYKHCKMKKISILSTFLMLSTMLLAQNNQNSSTASWIKNIPESEVIKWRQHIHQNPELSYQEVNTSNYVADLLERFGNINVIRPSKTSVVGILKGAKLGKIVAFRADMDALPVQEETGLPFTSKNNNISHACGHDAHTAMLLATAKTLSTMKSQIN